MRLWLIALSLSLVAACGSNAPPRADLQPAGSPTPVSGNFILYVSNQSFDRPTVDVMVFIDGERIVEQDFPVQNQHNWIDFGLDLTEGTHELRAISQGGDAELRQTITAGPHTWTALNYWCCGEPDDPKFTVTVSYQPVAFG